MLVVTVDAWTVCMGAMLAIVRLTIITACDSLFMIYSPIDMRYGYRLRDSYSLYSYLCQEFWPISLCIVVSKEECHITHITG